MKPRSQKAKELVFLHSSEESQQVVAGLIASIGRRWLNNEDRSVCALLDPRFKEVCFTNATLLLSIMVQLHKKIQLQAL